MPQALNDLKNISNIQILNVTKFIENKTFSETGQYDSIMFSNPNSVFKLSCPAIVLGAHCPSIIIGDNVGIVAFDQNWFNCKNHIFFHNLVWFVIVV